MGVPAALHAAHGGALEEAEEQAGAGEEDQHTHLQYWRGGAECGQSQEAQDGCGRQEEDWQGEPALPRQALDDPGQSETQSGGCQEATVLGAPDIADRTTQGCHQVAHGAEEQRDHEADEQPPSEVRAAHSRAQ